MDCKTKYPRTYHLPYSLGLGNDDKKAVDWQENIIGKEIVITEKLDGQNSSMTINGVFARSHSTPSTFDWDRNLWERGGTYDQIKTWLDEDTIIYGENLYGIHSIEYNRLPAYYFIFALRIEDDFTSWEIVEGYSELVEIPTVPVLFKGIVNSEKELEELVYSLMKQGSKFGDTIEGVVVRNSLKFKYSDFDKNVVKYVRENHVQTDEHWRKNWKKATLIYV
jgi:hypothetical protein